MTSVDNVAVDRLRQDGQRMTYGRKLLLDVLAGASAPLTIPMILAQEPRLAQSSVYRNLTILEGAGLVTRISLGVDHAFFELSEGVTGERRDHHVCTSCGAVGVISLSKQVEERMRSDLTAAARKSKFRATTHRTMVIGLCADCSAA